jgi:hypothetical protein
LPSSRLEKLQTQLHLKRGSPVITVNNEEKYYLCNSLKETHLRYKVIDAVRKNYISCVALGSQLEIRSIYL